VVTTANLALHHLLSLLFQNHGSSHVVEHMLAKSNRHTKGDLMNKNRIHKNIWLLGLVSLLNDISSEIIAPILPVLIKSLGGSGVSIGLIGGIRDGLTHLLKLAFGALSDHHKKRKPYVVLGYCTSTLFKGALIFAQSWQHIFLFVGLERLGKGVRTSPRDVLVAQVAPQAVAKNLGIIWSFDKIGATIGSIIVFLLMWLYKIDIKIIVGIAAVIALFALIPLFFITEPKQQIVEEVPTWSKLPASLKNFSRINSIFHLGNINYMFLMLRVHDCATIFSPVQNALLMYTSFNLMHALCATPFGSIIDALSKRSCVLAGYGLYGLVMIGFLLAQTAPQFWLLFMAYGAVLAFSDTSQRAFAIELAPANRQGTSIGMMYASMGVAQILGGGAAGLLWEYARHEYIFMISCATALMSIVLLVWPKSTRHTPAQ
jgi:MFS family permease